MDSPAASAAIAKLEAAASRNESGWKDCSEEKGGSDGLEALLPAQEVAFFVELLSGFYFALRIYIYIYIYIFMSVSFESAQSLLSEKNIK